MKKFTLHLNKLKYLGMFVLLFVISSCEKDFIPNEEKNSNRSELFLNPMTSLLHKGDAKEQFENLKKHLSNSGVAARSMGDSISFDWGRVLDEPVLQVTTSNGVRNTTFKVEVHEPHPNRFVNLVVTEEGDSLLSISLYGYMMDNDFAEAYHYNGVSIDKFSGAVLKFPITDTGSPCPPPVPIITTVEPDEDYTGGGQSYYIPGFPQTGASGFMGGFAGVYSSSYGTSSPLEYPETGNNSGGSWGVDIGGVVGNIGDVLGDIGEAIGDFFGSIAGWIGSLFSGDDCNGCATNDRPLAGFEDNSPNLYSGYLMYTPPLIENCEKPSVVGILEMHYSNESIATYLGISINDWLFLTMVQNAEFFRESMNFLGIHGFSHASLDFFHQVLADYRDDRGIDFTMAFFEFSLTPEQMAWWNNPINSAERAEIEIFLKGEGLLEENFNFIQEVIDFSNSNYDFEAETSEILTFEQDYRNRMSQAEIAIFDNLTRFQQLDYLHSAYLAETYAAMFYKDTPKVQYNGKGDAFRHCLWNAFGAAKLEVTLMKQLTDAHEVYDPGETHKPLEKTMDLHNNQVGRDIGSQTTILLMLKVKYAVDDGDTNYIYPTTSNGSVILGVSQIIPTDQ